jgi:hypothetical protein
MDIDQEFKKKYNLSLKEIVAKSFELPQKGWVGIKRKDPKTEDLLLAKKTLAVKGQEKTTGKKYILFFLDEAINRGDIIEWDVDKGRPPEAVEMYKVSQLDYLKFFLKCELEPFLIETENNRATPVTQSRDFSFINDIEVKKIIERDFAEIQRAFISKCWKSVIILSGGAIEAILLDQLVQNESNAKSSAKAPKNSDIKLWDLKDLIEVAIDLNLVHTGIDKLSHSVREYRNLVHPGNEIRNKLRFAEEEARIAIEVFNMLQRDLSR